MHNWYLELLKHKLWHHQLLLEIRPLQAQVPICGWGGVTTKVGWPQGRALLYVKNWIVPLLFHMATHCHTTESAKCNNAIRYLHISDFLETSCTKNNVKIYQSCQRHSWLLHAKVVGPPMEPSNHKHISHVVQIKTTKTIHMGWHCTIVWEEDRKTCTNLKKPPPPMGGA